MHFIVSGGAGFIGSHLTEQLLSEGHSVTVIDNLTTGNLQNLPEHSGLKFLHKNILDCHPEDFFTHIDGIAHLAATLSVTESWIKPLEAHDNNLSATLAVIKLCQALKVPNLVFASSAAVYGNKTPLSISEEQPPDPISPYGLQKLVSEQYAALFTKEFNFSFLGLRLFNVFGSRQVPGYQYSGVISIFVDAMLKNLPIKIYGDGTQLRAFEITELTTTSYQEREIDQNLVLKPTGVGWNGAGMHHIDPHLLHEEQWIACVDGRG